MKGWRHVRLPESDPELRQFFEQTTVSLCCVASDGRILWVHAGQRGGLLLARQRLRSSDFITS